MKIDSLLRNLLAYCSFFLLAVLVGGLESVHLQYQARRYVDLYDTIDAVIAYILPTLVLLLGAMKLPSVGHEPLAEKASDHEDRLELEDPDPPVPPAPSGAGQIPGVIGREGRG